MNQVQSFDEIFGSLMRLHRVLEETLPAVHMAADEPVGAPEPEMAEKAEALCRAMGHGGDDVLPTPDEAAGQPSRPEAATQLADECAAAIKMFGRIASPELRPIGGRLPLLTSSLPVRNGKGGHGADRHGDA